jgi:hypothetical protein
MEVSTNISESNIIPWFLFILVNWNYYFCIGTSKHQKYHLETIGFGV